MLSKNRQSKFGVSHATVKSMIFLDNIHEIKKTDAVLSLQRFDFCHAKAAFHIIKVFAG